MSTHTQTKPLTNQQILDRHHRHPPEVVEKLRRMLTVARLINGTKKPVDDDDLLKLVVEAYGHDIDSEELWRDLFALEKLEIIRTDSSGCWWPCKGTEFWPFGF